MARGMHSAEARRRISEAQTARWAKYRADKAAGLVPTKRGRRGRRGRTASRPMAEMGIQDGLSGYSQAELISMRRRIDQLLLANIVGA